MKDNLFDIQASKFERIKRKFFRLMRKEVPVPGVFEEIFVSIFLTTFLVEWPTRTKIKPTKIQKMRIKLLREFWLKGTEDITKIQVYRGNRRPIVFEDPISIRMFSHAREEYRNHQHFFSRFRYSEFLLLESISHSDFIRALRKDVENLNFKAPKSKRALNIFTHKLLQIAEIQKEEHDERVMNSYITKHTSYRNPLLEKDENSSPFSFLFIPELLKSIKTKL